MSNETELSPEARDQIESIRSQTASLVEQVAGLQRGWNHGASVKMSLDRAASKFDEVSEHLNQM